MEKGKLIPIASLLLAGLAIVVAVTIPEIRQIVGLDSKVENPQKKKRNLNYLEFEPPMFFAEESSSRVFFRSPERVVDLLLGGHKYLGKDTITIAGISYANERKLSAKIGVKRSTYILESILELLKEDQNFFVFELIHEPVLGDYPQESSFVETVKIAINRCSLEN